MNLGKKQVELMHKLTMELGEQGLSVGDGIKVLAAGIGFLTMTGALANPPPEEEFAKHKRQVLQMVGSFIDDALMFVHHEKDAGAHANQKQRAEGRDGLGKGMRPE